MLSLNQISAGIINGHSQQGGETDFALTVTNAVNQYWPGAVSPSGLSRKLVVLVGGPDKIDTLGTDPSGSRWDTLRGFLASKNIEHWAVGVNVGSSDAELLANLASTNNYAHYSQYLLSSDLLELSLPDMAVRLCPQGSVCGATCKGFCTCDDVCVCTDCVQDACVAGLRTCSPTVGCTGPPKPCNDGNKCNSQLCDIQTGCYFPQKVFCDDGSNCTSDQVRKCFLIDVNRNCFFRSYVHHLFIHPHSVCLSQESAFSHL